MKKELIEFFQDASDRSLSFKSIKKFLGVSKKHMDTEVRALLKELELEGILFEDKDGFYKSVPSNFYVKEIKETKKGSKYIEINSTRLYIEKKDLFGALPYDKVLVEITNGKARVKKVIMRNLPNVVCEVVLIDGKKHLKPINTDNDLDIIIGSKTMKKLVLGERVLIKTSDKMYDDKYEGEYLKTIGHKDDPDIDYKTVAYNHGFDLEFSKEALK